MSATTTTYASSTLQQKRGDDTGVMHHMRDTHAHHGSRCKHHGGYPHFYCSAGGARSMVVGHNLLMGVRIGSMLATFVMTPAAWLYSQMNELQAGGVDTLKTPQALNKLHEIHHQVIVGSSAGVAAVAAVMLAVDAFGGRMDDESMKNTARWLMRDGTELLKDELSLIGGVAAVVYSAVEGKHDTTEIVCRGLTGVAAGGALGLLLAKCLTK